MGESTVLALYWINGEEHKVTIRGYKELVKKMDKLQISIIIYHRFYDRYIKPFEYPSKNYKKFYKNGFAMMASGCLLIETLESFYNGWEITEGNGDKTFKSFFQRTQSLKVFGNIPFYRHIRCGILHQAETTGGYTISRIGPLFDNKKRVINSDKFLEELKKCLDNYKQKLETSKWDSEIWDNLRRKMRSIIRNCEKN